MQNSDFWPYVQSFDAALEASALKSVPQDWILILSDVKGSTQAIAEGRYQDVNRAGVLTLVAMANHCQNMRFPYVFGGDGVSLLVPPQSAEELRILLADLKVKVWESLRIELRIGIWEVRELYERGVDLAVGFYKTDFAFDPCIISGSGLVCAEDLLKNHQGSWEIQDLEIEKKATPNCLTEANFAGYSCRWADVPSPSDATIALMITCSPRDTPLIYRELARILGQDWNPLSTRGMRMRSIWATVWGESKILRAGKGLKESLNIVLVSLYSRLLVWACVHFKWRVFYHWMDLCLTPELNVQNADYRKYDGSLKMIAAVSAPQERNLESWLQTQHQSGRLCYGLHRSHSAHLTCALHVGSGVEVHFVDATGGGYTQASVQLKAQLKERGRAFV
jgi:hypothetical protein